MDMDSISTFINNVGFPIAVSIALFYQNMKTTESFNALQETVRANTKATERLENTIKYEDNRGEK